MAVDSKIPYLLIIKFFYIRDEGFLNTLKVLHVNS